jgi:hypothetical protein
MQRLAPKLKYHGDINSIVRCYTSARSSEPWACLGINNMHDVPRARSVRQRIHGAGDNPLICDGHTVKLFGRQ